MLFARSCTRSLCARALAATLPTLSHGTWHNYYCYYCRRTCDIRSINQRKICAAGTAITEQLTTCTKYDIYYTPAQPLHSRSEPPREEAPAAIAIGLGIVINPYASTSEDFKVFRRRINKIASCSPHALPGVYAISLVAPVCIRAQD